MERDIEPATWGPELEIKHAGAADTEGVGTSTLLLATMLSKQAGDLNIAGLGKYVDQLTARIDNVFGMVKNDCLTSPTAEFATISTPAVL